MLASDLNNPEFAGPVNPDEMLYVEFYWHEPLDPWASREKGYEVKLPRQPFVRIMKPGDGLSILEVPVREDHKQRFPQKWLYFQMKEGLVDDGKDIPGWKLEDWPEMAGKDEFLRGLKYLRFYTVEQLAGASDAQVQGIGLGGLGLREKAKAALREHISVAAKAELAERDTKINTQAEQIKALQEQVAALMETMTAPKAEEEIRRGPGRPPKNREEFA